jgi:drug/metabolite transporter (DMT)-like permease
VAMVALLAAGILARVRMPRREDVGWIVACGFFGMTAYQLLLNWGEVYVPAGISSIIVAAAPLVSVAAARVLFREKITPVTVIGSAVALAGVAYVCLARSGASLQEAVWIIVAAMVVQGIYHPLQKPLLARYTSLEVATYSMTAGTVMTLPFVPFGLGGLLHAGGAAWASAVYLGLLPSAVGFVLWAYAVARIPVAACTSLLYLVPPVAVLIAWAWLGEPPGAQEIVGGLIVIAGVATVSQGSRLLAAAKALTRPGGTGSRRRHLGPANDRST